MDEPTREALAALPRIDAVLTALAEADPTLAAWPRPTLRTLAREAVEDARSRVRDGEQAPTAAEVARTVRARTRALLSPTLRPVINATGVVVHTNLGRAPWASEAVEAACAVAGGYGNVELDLDTGLRGGRAAGVVGHLRALTGAEDALVVNNCAAAMLLALTALAAGREVIASRGELVEIGGSYRVPDIITACGARLVGVGTTNRTRIPDYAAALSEQTGVLLRVHPSNFRIVGFTEAPDPAELVALAHAHGRPAVYDLGSGSLHGAHGEPSVVEAVAQGFDIVALSGDKLLGGPQAGVILGPSDTLARLRRHALYRALRVDKVTLAALEATLALHRVGRPTPTDRMLAHTEASLHDRVEAMASALRAHGRTVHTVPVQGRVGGGASPDRGLAGLALALTVEDAEAEAARLRTGDPPVVARVARGRLLVDLRTVPEHLEPALLRRLAERPGSR